MNAVELHCQEIDRCNQRGARMLSIVDLVEAGTIPRNLAAYLLAAINAGASFMVGAVPGGAGKTTVMGALLNFVPADVELRVADGPKAIGAGLTASSPRSCYICHEIGQGHYYAYLWGKVLRSYFELPSQGHMLATNLHADTLDQAREQICGANEVPAADFRKMNLAIFLDMGGSRNGMSDAKGDGRRRIAQVWESDGTTDHVIVYDGMKLLSGACRLGSPDRVAAAGQTLEAIFTAGSRTIEKVRAFLVQ